MTEENEREGGLGVDFFLLQGFLSLCYLIAMIFVGMMGARLSQTKVTTWKFLSIITPPFIDILDLTSDCVLMVLIVRESKLYELMISMFCCLIGHQVISSYFIWFKTSDIQYTLFNLVGCRELLEIYDSCRLSRIDRKFHFVKPLRTIFLNHPFMLAMVYYVVTHPVPKFTYLSLFFTSLSMCSRVNFFDASGLRNPRWLPRIVLFNVRFFELMFHMAVIAVASYAFRPLPVYWFMWGQSAILIIVEVTVHHKYNIFPHRTDVQIVESTCLHVYFINLFSDDVYAYLSNAFKVLEILVLLILLLQYGITGIHPNLALLIIFSVLIVCSMACFDSCFQQCHCFDLYDYNAAMSDNHKYFIEQQLWDTILEHLDREIISPDPCLAYPLHKWGNVPYTTLRYRYMVDLLDEFSNVKLKDLLLAGYTVPQLKNAGYNIRDFYQAEIAVTKIKGFFSLEEIKRGGYDIHSVVQSGTTLRECNSAGYTVAAMNEAGYAPQELLHSGIHRESVREGYTAETARLRGLTPRQALDAGYSIRDLRQGGYRVSQLREIGRTAVELYGIYPIKEIRNAGYTAAEVDRIRNITLAEFRQAGYTVSDVRQIGYQCDELKNGGYTSQEMRHGGFTCPELYACGYKPRELRSAGFSALQMHLAGLTIGAIRQAGFTTMDLRDAGLTCEELLKEFSVRQLIRDGWSTRELRSAGITWKQIVAASGEDTNDTHAVSDNISMC